MAYEPPKIGQVIEFTNTGNIALVLVHDLVVCFRNTDNPKACGLPRLMSSYHLHNIKYNLGNIHTLVEQINAGSYREE